MLTDAFNTLNIVDKCAMFLVDHAAVPVEQRDIMEAVMQGVTEEKLAKIQQKAEVIRSNPQKWVDRKYGESATKVVMKLQNKFRSSRLSRSGFFSTTMSSEDVNNNSNQNSSSNNKNSGNIGLKLSSDLSFSTLVDSLLKTLGGSPSGVPEVPITPVQPTSTSSSVPPSVPHSTMPTSHSSHRGRQQPQQQSNGRHGRGGRGGRGLAHFVEVDNAKMEKITPNLNLHGGSSNANSSSNNNGNNIHHSTDNHSTTHKPHLATHHDNSQALQQLLADEGNYNQAVTEFEALNAPMPDLRALSFSSTDVEK
jgi:hypothetical protein